MSGQQPQQGGQPRQPVSYPSPTSYPSPGLSNAQYSYPAPNTQPASEPYRASPTGSNGAMPLPSMRSLDPLQQQQAQQPYQPGALPPPVGQMPPYYHPGQTLPHPQHQYPNVTSDPTGQGMRYALPAPDNRVMSGGRHKKEIKRRTKTGCLTCRKRRIKCDEQHPACRNCQKSKRECLGYDPIFKQQPGPTNIQPAPSSAPAPAPIVATANPYGNQPLLQGYTAQVPPMTYDPALSAGVSSPGSSNPHFDYASAIDPALEAVAPPPVKSANMFEQPSAKLPTTIDELLNLGGAEPQSVPGKTQEPEFLDELRHLYHSIYSVGLESFLESKWFTVKGSAKLMSETKVLDLCASLLAQFARTTTDDEREMAYTSSVEARVVWGLAKMVRDAASEGASANGVKPEAPQTEGEVKPELTHPAPVNPEGTVPPVDDAVEAGNRLTVFENLLCGIITPSNPLVKPVPGAGDPHRARELEFWYNLGRFVTLSAATSAKEMDDILSILRNLLDGRENRDVIYSIAVVRAYADRVAEYSEHDRPLHLDETDVRSKLAVAKQFLRNEAAGGGTTNVIRRLCELVARTLSK